ncbi:hypothetical protein KIPE111705_25745 [Kibdelosporangium persicum]|uniref:Flagellar protein FlgN n=1 Tax=Kibdelosporangium persicum TaxID=2698649 RepID=A0ABX2FHL4_9PSEU|nr:hypothetical protein [Kibdelosporangium persicum]NRN70589.1 hypothetical protein [Kibdelosporangium persicum]
MTNPMRAAAQAIAGELESGAWHAIQADVVRLFPDVPAFGSQLRADADVLASTAGGERQRLIRDVAAAWEHRLAMVVSRNPALEASVMKLAERAAPRTAFTQNNTPANGGIVFANQGGPQNVYRTP